MRFPGRIRTRSCPRSPAPGKEAALPPLPPLRTVHATFTAHGSSLSNAHLRTRHDPKIRTSQYWPVDEPPQYCGVEDAQACAYICNSLLSRFVWLSCDETPGEVCSLSRAHAGYSLHYTTAFASSPSLPAPPSALLTVGFPHRSEERYGLTTFRSNDRIRFRLSLFADSVEKILPCPWRGIGQPPHPLLCRFGCGP